MLRYINYNIVFQEVPGEVTLAINISNCPNHCKDCHSPYLWKDTGTILDKISLMELVNKYRQAITCVCFMGGDIDPEEVQNLSVYLKKQTDGQIKTGWYSGKNKLPACCSIENFNYIKLGAFIKELGGLSSSTTNQRFYKIEEKQMIDMTRLFAPSKSFS
ncbi:anaerobic ribonucleoside-triphosphate reductase activating protein [Bacteroidales bacterium OttesenSCG-928-M11]|nr:anaerobic ribonucleoside-triphosphate reductase activating protein [Bacteroidales bacterium OttesenSCG-928-M11]